MQNKQNFEMAVSVVNCGNYHSTKLTKSLILKELYLGILVLLQVSPVTKEHQAE
jgi:hypothetical protein